MHYTIYRITNTINGKYYIGKHQTENINDHYFGSGKAVVAAIKQYGKENFTKEILFVYDNQEEMNAKEREIINEDIVNDHMSYNMGIGGEGGAHFKGKKHSRETKEKISKIHSGQVYEYDRYSESRQKSFFKKGNQFWKNRSQKSMTEETKEKIREKRKTQIPPNLGRKMSEETKEKIRQSIINKNMPV